MKKRKVRDLKARVLSVLLCMAMVLTSGNSISVSAEGQNADTTSVKVLNASELAKSTLTESTAFGDFTIIASSDATVVIDGNNKSADEFSFTQRIKLGGTGAIDRRAISFAADGKSTVTVYAMSSSSSADRDLVLADATGAEVDAQKALGASLTKAVYSIAEAGTYYLYSKESGINVYYVSVAAAEEQETPGEGEVVVPGEEEVTPGEGEKEPSESAEIPAGLKDIYVAPQATGTGASESDPTNFEAAILAVEPGATIHMADGVYSYDHKIIIEQNNSGTEGAMKTIRANSANAVTLDFSAMGYTGSEADKQNRGVILDGSYWNIYGINFTGAADNGMILAGNHNILEMCVFYANHDTGLQVSRYRTDAATIDEWPSYNLIKNCTAYNNCDIEGENADGFAAKLTCGVGNVFDGCMSYNNSDDGWDMYAKTATGPIGVVTLKNCIAFRNGKLTDGSGSADGDMNGFKLGGSGVGTPHIVINCIAFENGAHGFTDNNNPTAITLENCTSFNNSVYSGSNKANFQMNREAGGVNKNLLSFTTGKIGSDGFIGTIENSVYYNNSPAYYQVGATTSINKGDKLGSKITVSASDFENITAPAATSDFHKIWRNEDGSINTGNFLAIAQNSALAGLGIGSTLPVATGAAGGEETPEVDPVTPEEPKPVDPETPVTTAAVLNASELALGDIVENTVVGDFELIANASKKLTVDSNAKSIDGFDFTQRIKTNGTGANDYRAIKYTATDAAVMTVYAMSGSNSKDRDLVLANADGEVARATALGASISKLTLVIPAAGEYYLYSGDSGINIYYVAVGYAAEEENKQPLPEVDAIAPVDSKIDVWDFGAEVLDENVYNNRLTADIINGFYEGIAPGTTGQAIGSFSVSDAEGKVVFEFNGAGKVNHRIRSANPAITRYDDKTLTYNGVTYQGYVYSNASKNTGVYVGIELTAGDVITAVVSSNGNNSTIVFEAPSGAQASKVYDVADKDNTAVMTFYAGESGLYKLYSLDEKLCVARVSVQHTQPVNVVGYVDAPADLTADYAISFTCNETGVEYVANVENGTYHTVLNDGHTYTVALANANGYIVTSNKELALTKGMGGADNYTQFDVAVASVALSTISGSVVGLGDAIANLKLSFVSDAIYVPELTIVGDSYTVVVESGVEYVLQAEGVEDYSLVQPTTVCVTADCSMDIVFEAKPLHNVTIVPTGAALADLAEATFTFTRHSDADVTAEEDYVYTFVGTDNIKLRDGVYTVKVTGVADYKQKLTSNLKVEGADVTKTIAFEFTGDPTAPQSWDFKSDEYVGQDSYNGLTIVGGKKHGATYGMMIKNGTISVPVKGDATITVAVGYTWDLAIADAEAVVQTTDGGTQTLTYDYKGEAGVVVITAGANATSYVSEITVTPVAAEDEVLPCEWNFTADEYTGQASYNQLVISNGKKHGATYGMMIKNGYIDVPVSGAATVKVAVGYTWDITVDGVNALQTTDGGFQELSYEYTGSKGVVRIEAGANATSYIRGIVVENKDIVATDDIVLTVGASGCDYTTINAALAAAKKMNRQSGQRFVIEIQPGNYEEMLVIDIANVTLKNASATPSIATTNKGVDIDANAVRITSYYGHGYTYYSMNDKCKYDEELLAVNKENGYASFENPGSGTTNGSFWNATVVINAGGFQAENIIFENSFNQYVSEKAANDVIVAQSSAKEGSVPRASMQAGDTTVQNKKYVERAAALAIGNNVKEVSFDHCSFIGRQDTLYGGVDTTAAFYECKVYGGTDYIFGGMVAVFAKCDLVLNTMEDGNDVAYIVAPQQKAGRGYLMYNCTVTSTVPGVDTASEKISKPGYFGRPWQQNTSETVFYATIIEKSCNNTSLIQPEGWLNTLSGTSDNLYEFGTYEMLDGVDNSSKRVSWANPAVATIEGATLKDGTPVTVASFLGDWDAFAGKDMTVVYPDGKEIIPVDPTPEPTTETTVFTLDTAADLTAFAAGAKADGDEQKAGTEDFFTIIYSAKSKVDSSSKTFEDGYASSQRLNLGGKVSTAMNAVKFTTTEAATVKIWWAEGGDDNRQIGILNAAGELVAVTTDTVAKNSPCISTLKLAEAGTYYLGGDINNNYIFKIEVTVEKPAEPVVSILDTAADLTAFAAGAKADGEEEQAGTNNYFTIIYSAKSKVDSSSKTFEDGYASSQRLNLGGKVAVDKNAVKFTTSGAASVKVWWAEGGDDNRQIGILNAAGELVAVTADTVAKNAVCISTLELAEAGTYYLGGDINNNYIFRIEVTEGGSNVKPARADWAKVAAPEVTNVVCEAGTITVSFKALIGYDGADKVTVSMIDLAGNVVASKNSSKEGTEGSVSFTPENSGRYSFVVVAIREGEEDKASGLTQGTNFVLPLTTPNVKSATSKGNGSVEVEWDAVKEATLYKVLVDGVEVLTTGELSAIVTGLTVGTEYTFSVVAVRGEDVSEAGSIKATVSADAQRTWAFSAYGDGVDTTNNGYVGNINDGSVTVYGENGKGKIVPGSTDGLAFYYTTINPETENFTLTATIHVDKWTLSNGQEGFGMMAADSVGLNGDKSIFWNNTYQLIGSKVEYYFDGTNVTDNTEARKITMKLGLGALAKTGVTAADVAAIKAGTQTMPLNYSTKNPIADTLELSATVTGKTNLFGNCTNGDKEGITEIRVQMQRNNDGFVLRYLDAEGNVIGEKLYYDQERTALTQLDAENIYIGFFASRNARITVTDVELTTIAPEDDAESTEHEIETVTSVATIESATFANSASYDMVYYGNMDGQLTITAQDGTVVADSHVNALTKTHALALLTEGENSFQVTFVPDADFKPGKYQQMSSLDTVSFTHVVLYSVSNRTNIYVSPNGTATAAGTKADPMDIYTAVKVAKPGATIVLAGGTYNLTRTVKVERGINGTADAVISMVADPTAAERPVFDFGGRCSGMVLAGDYWYFRGFDVTNSADGQKGIQVSGNNNTVDQVNTYKNGNTGLQISRYLSTDERDQWPCNNLILNCSSYLNADRGYEDADGFAAKLTCGEGNVFDGCIAMYNADDGWDLYAKVQTGSIGSVTIKNSVAYKNGYVLRLENGTGALDLAGTEVNAGNGNGFKMGGDGLAGAHVLMNSIAFGNKAKGIDSNSCPDIHVYNSISFNNESYNVAMYTKTTKNTAFVAENIISYKNAQGNNIGEDWKPLGTQKTEDVINATNYFFDGSVSSNTEGVTVNDGWFVSVDMTKALAGGITRNADGTINMNGFLEVTGVAGVAGARFDAQHLTASKNVVVEEESELVDVTESVYSIQENYSIKLNGADSYVRFSAPVVTVNGVVLKLAEEFTYGLRDANGRPVGRYVTEPGTYTLVIRVKGGYTGILYKSLKVVKTAEGLTGWVVE